MTKDIGLYTTTVQPAEEPITLTEAKAFLRQDATKDDAIITALIIAARMAGEALTNRVFVTRTIKAQLSCQIVNYRAEHYPFIELHRSPLIAITSIQAFIGGSLTAITPTHKRRSTFDRLLFIDELTTVDVDQPYPYEVVFTAGYGAAADVPNSIKQALLMHVAFLYENRGDTQAVGGVSVPVEVLAMYQEVKIASGFGGV